MKKKSTGEIVEVIAYNSVSADVWSEGEMVLVKLDDLEVIKESEKLEMPENKN